MTIICEKNPRFITKMSKLFMTGVIMRVLNILVVEETSFNQRVHVGRITHSPNGSLTDNLPFICNILKTGSIFASQWIAHVCMPNNSTSFFCWCHTYYITPNFAIWNRIETLPKQFLYMEKIFLKNSPMCNLRFICCKTFCRNAFHGENKRKYV